MSPDCKTPAVRCGAERNAREAIVDDATVLRTAAAAACAIK
jgi:hypothetical protein